jgi:quercetin dioxygenase-like cupin family protein
MFGVNSPDGYYAMAPGIRIKTIAHGDRVLMTKFLMDAGAILPSHSHPNEQIGYLLSGRIILHIGDSSRDVGPGDSWCVPSGVAHRADVLEGSAALEIFSPIRADYLAFLNEADIVE